MTKFYDVKVTVVSQEGHCEEGMKVGDEWIIKAWPPRFPEGMCLGAWGAISSAVNMLKRGGSWYQRPKSGDKVNSKNMEDLEPRYHYTLACPDGENPVHLLVSRIEPEE